MSITNTPLHIAIQNGNIEIIKTLLASGCALDARNADGLTPLDLAIATNNTEIVQLLLEHQNKVHTSNTSGQAISSSTGIANRFFVEWKKSAIIMNIFMTVVILVTYVIWTHLPSYLEILIAFGITNLVALLMPLFTDLRMR